MAGITNKSIREYLKQQSKEDLIKQIMEICTKFGSVKDYYATRVNPQDDTVIIDKYKAVIKNEFFPSRGFGKGRLSIARKAVLDYGKVSVSKEGLADIMLFYVETGVRYTLSYGDIDEPFYNSMESMYNKALKHIIKNDLAGKFQNRCKSIVDDTEGLGWGFHDNLRDLYDEYFEDCEE